MLKNSATPLAFLRIFHLLGCDMQELKKINIKK